jgi:cytochrome c oxidase cbb3-type subunit 3
MSTTSEEQDAARAVDEGAPTDDRYEDILLDHNYDGITEYDNPMPAWWSGLFVVTVIWAVIYVVAINLGLWPTYEESLSAGQDELAAIRHRHRQSQPIPEVDEAYLAEQIGDAKLASAGAEVFKGQCSACHGNQGQGLVGPNLTDRHWLYGNSPMEAYKSIDTGRPNGMPDWGNILQTKDMIAVVVYIASVQGTEPPEAKKPEGDEFGYLKYSSAAGDSGDSAASEAPAGGEGAEDGAQAEGDAPAEDGAPVEDGAPAGGDTATEEAPAGEEESSTTDAENGVDADSPEAAPSDAPEDSSSTEEVADESAAASDANE